MIKSKRNYLIPIIGFAVIILIGAIFLHLPISNVRTTTFQDAFFTATSALTTSGFLKSPILEQYSFFGQFVLVMLMEIGALGFIIFVSYFWILKNKKIKISDMNLINDSISNDNYALIKERTIFICRLMFKVQILGIILLALKFIPRFGIFNGIWYSIFHTVSAFSNCGFDLFGETNLEIFKNDFYVQIILICLMLIGNIGVLVIEDVIDNKTRKFYRLKLQSKIVIITSIVVTLIPMLFIKLFDSNLSIINSLFMSVTTRSTGFTITNVSLLSIQTKVILLVLMFIGGSPSSSAGGIKVTTLAILFATVMSTLRDEKNVIMFNRKISDVIIRKAFTIVISFIFVLTVTSIIFYEFNNIGMFEIVFNSVSAITNTGLSILDYKSLNIIGEYILIFLMYMGRISPLTALLMFVRDEKGQEIEYPSENIIL